MNNDWEEFIFGKLTIDVFELFQMKETSYLCKNIISDEHLLSQ